MSTEIKCIIVDDEEIATKIISSHLSHFSDFKVVGVYHSAVEAFSVVESHPIDVLFLDIQMPKVTGIEMLKTLKNPPLTILTTAHRDYAIESYELDVVDYLLKPIGLRRFMQAISRVRQRLQLPSGQLTEEKSNPDEPAPSTTLPASGHVFIKTNRAFQKVAFLSILHIEAIKNHVKVVTKKDTLISFTSLSDFEAQLPTDFLRVHRSFVVNKQNILTFNTYSIKNQNREIPIGRTYKETVMENLRTLL